jgi:hypothetical protein
MCKDLDSFAIRLCHLLTVCLGFLCCPVKFVFKPLTNNFQRPYSICFLLSYFLLIIPAILLLVMLIQSSSFINELYWFTSLFYLTLINLLINYILVFHIYNVYGLHKIEYHTQVFTVKSFIKYAVRYLFTETKLGYIGIYFLAQSIFGLYNLIYILRNKGLNSDSFDLPVLVTFTLYAVVSGIAFTLGHLVVYFSLFMLLFCKINNSCCCGVFAGYRNNKKVRFHDRWLDCFKLFGIYDIEKGGIELNIINNI